MDIKEIRKESRLTQKDFAIKYQIPLQTLKQWESCSDSKSYRKPPDYVVSMLNTIVSRDHIGEDDSCISRTENLQNAAEESRYNMAHWLRYLRKEFIGNSLRLSAEQLMTVLNSDRLSVFQKVCLKQAATPETETRQYIISLNEHARPNMLDAIIWRRNNGQ